MTTAMSSAGTGSVSSSAAKRAAIILATARRESAQWTASFSATSGLRTA